MKHRIPLSLKDLVKMVIETAVPVAKAMPYNWAAVAGQIQWSALTSMRSCRKFVSVRQNSPHTFRRFMKSTQLVRLLPPTAVAIFFSSCAELPRGVQQPSGWWNDQGGSGSPRIIVHVTEQKAYFYRGEKVVGESTVSTGKRGFSTPLGYYRVVSKSRDHVSSIFGDYVDKTGKVVKSDVDSRKDRRPPGTHFDGARMPYAMFFRGGYAMHQGYVPPYAASHGCIRLPKGMAEHFYNAAHEGTPVIVKE